MDNYCNTNELKTCFQWPELSADVCTKSSFVLISGPKRNLEEIRSFVFTNKDIAPSDVMSFGTQVCVYMRVCVSTCENIFCFRRKGKLHRPNKEDEIIAQHYSLVDKT